MIALIQRVAEASVTIEGRRTATIDSGMLALIGIKPGDDAASASKLLGKLLKFRIFEDDAGKMNLDLVQADGSLLLVPQFTLAADTRHGSRPGFSTAAAPELAKRLFQGLVDAARTRHPKVANGEFGANMRVALINDGPVTFWLESD